MRIKSYLSSSENQVSMKLKIMTCIKPSAVYSGKNHIKKNWNDEIEFKIYCLFVCASISKTFLSKLSFYTV